MGILVTYDIGIAQCDNRTVKYEKKKKREPLNVIKIQSHMMLVLSNLIIKTVKCEKKIKEPSNVIKVQSYMMLALPNVIMEPSNVKKREQSNVIKVRLHMMLVLPYVAMEPSNMRKKKRELLNVVLVVSNVTMKLLNVKKNNNNNGAKNVTKV